MNPKRYRSVNWDDEEKQLFRRILKDYSQILENKALDTTTNQMKNKAWEEIHNEFNSLNYRPRDLGQLKVQWKILKLKNPRKTLNRLKNKTIKTVSESRPATPEDYVTEDCKPDVVYLDEIAKFGQEHQQDSNLMSMVEVDLEEEDRKFSPCRSSDGDQKDDVIMGTQFKTNSADKSQMKDHDCQICLIGHAKHLKDEEHKRRMEMAEEEHIIKLQIHQEKLKCAILEREILELRKARELQTS